MPEETKIPINITKEESTLTQDLGINPETAPLESGEEINLVKEASTQSKNNSVVEQFNQAFQSSSQIIQDYITSDKLTEDIELICKIEKLTNPNSQTILENISVSLLVGLLSFADAKETILESFKVSGMILNQIEIINIMNDIDKYILSNVRKQILDDNLKKTKVIKHLTLKEKEDALTREELRKILLDRTGNLTGQGALFQYKKPDFNQKSSATLDKVKEKNQAYDRESLLKNIHLNGITTEQGVEERMVEIKKELASKESTPSVTKPEEVKEDAKQKVVPEETTSINKPSNLSYVFAERLKDQLASNLDKKVNLDQLRQKRGKEEEDQKKQQETTSYAKEIAKTDDKIDDPDFDPYRENV